MENGSSDDKGYRAFKFGELDMRPGAAGRKGQLKEAEDSFKQIYGPRIAAVAERLKAQEEEAKLQEDPGAKARELLAEAEEEAKKIKAAAQAEGYAAGLAEGRQKLLREAERLTRVAVEIAAVKPRLVKESTDEVINLVCAVCEKILGPLSEKKPECVVYVVENALAALSERETVTVRVNPADKHLLIEAKPDILAALDGIRTLTFLDDHGVPKGGCIVETGSTEIDARLKTQLDELIRALGEAK